MEIKGGEGGEESALFAADLAAHVRALRGVARVEDRDPRSHGIRPGRLQRRPDRDQVERDRPVAGRLGAPQVRGRRAPRSARAGDRVAGAHPHLDDRRARVPRGRRPRRGRRSTRTISRSTCSARRAPAASRSTRRTLLFASRTCPPASSCRCRTRRASCRTARRGCACCAHACSRASRRSSPPSPRTPARARSATMDRSERIRTYNFPENRIADHRTGYKAYNLDQVMNGALEPRHRVLHPGRRRGPARRDLGCDRPRPPGERHARSPRGPAANHVSELAGADAKPGCRRPTSTPSC